MITKNQTKIKTVLTFAFLAMATVALTTATARAQTMSASLTAPVVNNSDIANYGTVTGSDKWWAENNTGAGSAKGQTFTTGSEPLVLKSITYQVTSTQKAEPTKTYVVRVGTVLGTTFTEMHSETFTQDFTWNASEYMTWTLGSPVLLAPNTLYGIDIGMTNSTSAWQTGIPYINVTADEYPGGLRYSSGQFGVGDSEIHPVTNSDRIFHIDLRVQGPVYISPTDKTTLDVGNIDLLWENDEPTDPCEPVYVDVWFGTDPVSDFNKVVSADPNRTSYTADATTPGTYYWQVVNYINGAGNINEPNELAGPVWSFDAVTDLPPEFVDAGVDMMTWDGQPVQLDPNVVDDGKSALTYAWSADPAVGVSFDPSAAVEAPAVTVDISQIPITVTRGIQEETDDGEEYLNTVAAHGDTRAPQGGIILDSSDLDVGNDNYYNQGGPEKDGLVWQVVAVQYAQLGIPQGSTITSAKLAFQLDEEVVTYPSNDFTIYAEAADDASVFTLDPNNISNRDRSTASVGWNPPTTGIVVGDKVDTPDLSALIQELVGRPGWSKDNRLTLMIYPDVYLEAADPNTKVSRHTYQAGPGADSATLTVQFYSDDAEHTEDLPIPVELTFGVSDEGNPTPVTDTMTIDVYKDACQMARMGLGLSNISDFDENCVTDLKDYAILAAKWLKDVSLTAPVLKP